ncbi:DUF2971 domain-containing protein [uncultured Ruminococcus sp.]|uniref:DUF2971 domain-containing protein n=1 Tax=uncultured Ruminococcus sp. TaxID=165186 RepID=UPI0025DC6662|nr:DUF2971 domain-containing protein [uncultured Ruminococcus sp.]
MKNLEVLYHYTTLGTFEKIVKNGYLAMFDIIKSNDPLEGKFALDALKSAYDAICINDDLAIDKLTMLKDSYHAFLEAVESFGKLRNVVCSLSFCKPTHKLLLWRTYGDNGKGIAIGVGLTELEKFNELEHFEFRKVEYKSKNDYILIAKQMLLKAAEMSEINAFNEIAAFYYNGYFIKESYNSDEEEYRLIFKGIDLNNYILPSCGDKIENVEMLATSNNDMKIFYKLSICKTTKDNLEPFIIINNISIGPNCKCMPQEIRMLLRLHDIDDHAIMRDDISMR